MRAVAKLLARPPARPPVNLSSFFRIYLLNDFIFYPSLRISWMWLCVFRRTSACADWRVTFLSFLTAARRIGRDRSCQICLKAVVDLALTGLELRARYWEHFFES